jgi:Cu+-exporting ATPase
MLSGDRREAVESVAQSVGMDEFHAQLMPEEKLAVAGKLKEKYLLAMVGDGVNDAPALAGADIGIAIGSGSASACDAAGIVITGDDISQVSRAILLSRATMRVIKQNLFWAFCYNIIAIPVAAGAFYSFGIPALPPGICSALMAVSSLTVILNAARLKGIKL